MEFAALSRSAFRFSRWKPVSQGSPAAARTKDDFACKISVPKWAQLVQFVLNTVPTPPA
jgi:hypothetical protein